MINNLVQRYDKAGSKDMEIFTFTGYHQIPLQNGLGVLISQHLVQDTVLCIIAYILGMKLYFIV